MRKLGLMLAAALLAAAVLPGTAAAAGNIGRQGTKSAPVTVHCWYDANNDVYDVLWTVAPDVNTQLTGQEAGFFLWSAASGKYSAPSELIDQVGYDPYATYYSDLGVWAPEWPAGYVTVQAVVLGYESVTVIASGTAKCQRATIEVY